MVFGFTLCVMLGSSGIPATLNSYTVCVFACTLGMHIHTAPSVLAKKLISIRTKSQLISMNRLAMLATIYIMGTFE